MKLSEKKNNSAEKTAEPERSPIQEAFSGNLKFMNQAAYPADFFRSFWDGRFGIERVTVGEADFPSGEVVLADPLAYLGTRYETVLEGKLPVGNYPIELAIFRSPMTGLRVAAARLKIKDAEAVSYKLAMPKGHTEEDFNKPGVFCFFGVDAGMACITDKAVSEGYGKFLRKWHDEHPDGNHYDDYFAELLAESYRAYPDLQTPYGDFLKWSIPESGKSLIIFSSGLGDGLYSGYWGIDEKGDTVELAVPFMNPEFFE